MKPHVAYVLPFAIGICLTVMAVRSTAASLLNGRVRLEVSPMGGSASTTIALDGNCVFGQSNPVRIGVVDAAGNEVWYGTGYKSVNGRGAALACDADVDTPTGTKFVVKDVYRKASAPDGFVLSRTVEIRTQAAADKGFNSEFSVRPSTSTQLSDVDVFAPGVWYKDNAHVPQHALAGNRLDRYYLFREDRLPLPVIATRDRRNGLTVALTLLDSRPSTFAGENGLDRIIDARMQFGSMGLTNIDRPCPTFRFPGTEGERSYIAGPSTDGHRWAYRSHPVLVGVRHRYRLLIRVERTPDYPTAVRSAWRTAYDAYSPLVLPADLHKVYKSGMEFLSTVTRAYDGVVTVPFAATAATGGVYDTSSQMGFVGQALPSAALLLRFGYETRDADVVRRAEAVVDFWVKNCEAKPGVPRTWYDNHPTGVTWRGDHVFLRVASDGFDGALTAWKEARKHGQDRPAWLAFCRRYGDWLLSAQNADGAWAREFDFDGKPVSMSTDTTDQPIPFLCHLYAVTRDRRYRDAALRAGAFCLRTVHAAYAYVGGTPDNPNVMDKEGGMMALAAFLSLYDLTKERRYLDAASQAAWYSETWVYCRHVPIPAGDPKAEFPSTRSTVGISLIASGHSGADDYMASAPYYFYRLWKLTGERHFRRSARMLLYDTKQMMDWDGALGYRYPGALKEAFTLAPPRGHGTKAWLPWLSVAILRPLADLQDAYGSMDIEEGK